MSRKCTHNSIVGNVLIIHMDLEHTDLHMGHNLNERRKIMNMMN